jgi:hypothetical protein
MSDSLERFDVSRGRVAFAAAILHTVDLDALEQIHLRLASPQALVEGVSLVGQMSLEQWLGTIHAAKALREATSTLEADVIQQVETNLPAGLKLRGREEPSY